jgi:hypothetical protein
MDEPVKKSKNKNIRDLHREMKGTERCYQPRSNFVKDENGGRLLAQKT